MTPAADAQEQQLIALCAHDCLLTIQPSLHVSEEYLISGRGGSENGWSAQFGLTVKACRGQKVNAPQVWRESCKISLNQAYTSKCLVGRGPLVSDARTLSQ